MKENISDNEYQISLPYLGAKYSSFFSLMMILSILINDLGRKKEIDFVIIIAIIIAVGIFMIKEIRKKRIIIIEESNLIIDGLPLEANEIKSTKINRYCIEFETNKKRRSQRIIRFDFKGIDKETHRNTLKEWLRRQNIRTKQDL
ncbi:hypothetical protein PMSD_20755 [Paenibacillus macquariensis subsp. defensor]|nr:hypothetical protein PMSD_20755 [Paenibacillus macquariensis subsp. defensor]